MQFKKGRVRSLCFVVLGLIMAIISGCASVPKASSVQDHQAKLFKTHPQKSNLYIYRGHAQGVSIEMPLEINGWHVATNLGKTYIKLQVAPGKHRIISRADNSDRLILATQKNKNYFIFQDVKVGSSGTLTKLNFVTEAVGQAGVNECEMISLIPQATKLSQHQ